MTPTKTVRRTVSGWLGIGLAAGVMAAGAAVGAHAAPARDPHEVAAQAAADHVLGSFVAPPGAKRAASPPEPVPSQLQEPPLIVRSPNVARTVGWYYASVTPQQVLAWVHTHPPVGSTGEGGGSGSSPEFATFGYRDPDSTLYVTPETGADGRTVIRLDATVGWYPSRSTDSLIRSTATSVSVHSINPLNPGLPLPKAEMETLTSTDPAVVGQITNLINGLTPPRGGVRHCPLDLGVSVIIDLPGAGHAEASAGGCGGVQLTLPGRAPLALAGAGDLIPNVYALFGVTWQNGFPPPEPAPNR